jgi:hypothetical protein
MCKTIQSDRQKHVYSHIQGADSHIQGAISHLGDVCGGGVEVQHLASAALHGLRHVAACGPQEQALRTLRT